MKTNAYKVLGTTQDVDTCECCGKTGLKKTVMLIWLDEEGNEDGHVVHFGTTCASHAILSKTGKHVTAKEIKEEAEMADSGRRGQEKRIAKKQDMNYIRREVAVTFLTLNRPTCIAIDRGCKRLLIYESVVTDKAHKQFDGKKIMNVASPRAYADAAPYRQPTTDWIQYAHYRDDGSVIFCDRHTQEIVYTMTREEVNKATLATSWQ